MNELPSETASLSFELFPIDAATSFELDEFKIGGAQGPSTPCAFKRSKSDGSNSKSSGSIISPSRIKKIDLVD